MDFEYSAKTKDWIKRVSAFMDKHIYPNVETFEKQHAAGRAHAALGGVFLRAPINLAGGALNGVFHDRQDFLARRRGIRRIAVPFDDVRVVTHRATDRVNRDLGRHLARRVTAHAVGDDEEM